MKIEVDVSTEKAKKSLQNLAKETSKNLQVEQNRSKTKTNQYQQKSNNLKQSNLLGLTALGASMVALSKATDKNNAKLVETDSKLSRLDNTITKLDESIKTTSESISKMSKVIDTVESATQKKWGNLEGRRDLRRLRQQGIIPSSMSYKEFITTWNKASGKGGFMNRLGSFASNERDSLEIIRGNERARLGNSLRELALLRRRRSLYTSGGNKNLLHNLTPMQQLGLNTRDWLSKKAMGFGNRLGGLPLIGGFLGGAGSAMSSAVSAIPSSMLGALGGASTVASAVAVPLAAIGGGLMAGNKMISDGRQVQSQREQLQASIGQLQFNKTGSREVSGITDDIIKFSINGVNSVEDLNGAVNALMMSFEGNSSEVRRWLPLIDDVAAATGVSASQMGEMIARVNESGVAESRVINSLSTKGIPIYRELGNVLGKTTEEAKKMAREGEISAATFEKALQRIGKSVEGTSAQLSSSTLAGAESSWQNADSLAHASATEAADRSRIEMLNRMTDDAMAEAQDVALMEFRAAAGHGTQAVKNFFYELWDGATGLLEDSLGGLLIPLGAHSAASSSLNREVEKRVDEIRNYSGEITEDAIQEQIKALREYKQQLNNKLGMEWLGGIDFMLDSTRAELEKTIENIDDVISQKIRDERLAYEQRAKQADELKKQMEREIAESEANRQREIGNENQEGRRKMDRQFWEKILQGGENSSEAGLKMALRGVLSTYGIGVTPENVEEVAGRLHESARENYHLFGGNEVIAEELRGHVRSYEEAMKALKEREEAEKRKLEEERREREKANLQFRSAIGDDTATGELMLYDRANELRDNPHLLDMEKEMMLEAEAEKIYKDLASKALEGTYIADGIYGTAKGPEPAQNGYIQNAWGAACRTFYNYEKGYDKEQYEELKKNTQYAQDAASGIRTLTERFTISAQ